MFRKSVILYGLILLLLAGMSLLNGEELRRERESEMDFYFAPLPSFNEMFSALDYLEVEEYDNALEDEIYRVTEEVYQVAFALGVNTANAILATKARNREQLIGISDLMTHYAIYLGLSDEILKLGDELTVMIERGQWDALIASLERYREEVELSLYESRQFDIFTMMQLGGWTQGLNRTVFMLANNYSKEKSDIIAQKGILNSLINNLEHVRDDFLREQEFFQLSFEMYNMIRDIIYSYEEVYPPDAMEELYEITQQIKVSFR